MNESVLNYDEEESIGKITSVDTGTVISSITEDIIMSELQINQLIAIRSSRAGTHLIGMIVKMSRRLDERLLRETDMDVRDETDALSNVIKLVLVGELDDKEGIKENVFKRNVSVLPRIQASCFRIEGEKLSKLMKCISTVANDGLTPLSLGKYFIDENSTAYIDGDKFFQRHATIVGSTGSGKSYCVARLIEQMADLKSVSAVLFDIHGEYSDSSFSRKGISQLKIAAPNDLEITNKLDSGILMIPYWLLNYEEIQALLLDRSDSNAPNQAMQLSKQIKAAKDMSVQGTGYENKITIDSPIPYDLNNVLAELKRLDEERVDGFRAGSDKAGPFNGKLTRFNQRLENRISDKRVGFMFSIGDEEKSPDWLQLFCKKLMGTSKVNNGGIKVIDFSEVPSDILSLVIGLIARIIFSVQQWSTKDERHPIALLCDEAHLYVEQDASANPVSSIGLRSFERIAKEGRKYGISLVVISQRPSEVNKTVLSQCNNFISLRLTNVEDQNTIKRLLPDNLGNIADNLALLDVGEAIVVGDATLLPSRIKVDEPGIKPQSKTVPFWQVWSQNDSKQNLDAAVNNIIQQSRT